MICKLYSLIVIAAVSIGSQSTILAAEQCLGVDAITKSTLSLLATSQACETAATLNWKYSKTGGSRPFSYGKTTSYGTPGGNVSSSTPTKLTGLTPNTKYYFKVDNIYQNATKYTLTDTFRTQPSGTAVLSGDLNRATTGKQLVVNIGSTPIYITFSNEKTITVSLFSLNGSLTMKQVVSVQNAETKASISLNSEISGTYLCKITSQTGEITQKVVLQK